MQPVFMVLVEAEDEGAAGDEKAEDGYAPRGKGAVLPKQSGRGYE